MRHATIAATFVAILVTFSSAAQPGNTAIDWTKVDRELAKSPSSTTASSAAATAPSRLEKAQEEYEIGVLARRTEAFQWQAVASKVIFWMVLSLVVVGLVFSAFQFWVGLRTGMTADQELDLSLQGIKVRTQFLGVLTLAFSLAFFYLYLKTVYPIIEVGPTASQLK